MRISDWSSDVCSSDLLVVGHHQHRRTAGPEQAAQLAGQALAGFGIEVGERLVEQQQRGIRRQRARQRHALLLAARKLVREGARRAFRSEEHTSELQSLMRSSYAVFCLKKKTTQARTIAHA